MVQQVTHMTLPRKYSLVCNTLRLTLSISFKIYRWHRLTELEIKTGQKSYLGRMDSQFATTIGFELGTSTFAVTERRRQIPKQGNKAVCAPGE